MSNKGIGLITLTQSICNKFLLLLTIFLSVSCFTHAQSFTDPTKDGWRTNFKLLVDAEWDDNVFKLSDSQKDGMNQKDPGDLVSGRYNDMESINDIIYSIVPEVKLKTSAGLFSKQLSISGILDYQYYVHNNQKSNVRLGLLIKQNISKSQKLKFLGEYTPSYFVKNYLFDATDSTGHVSSYERIYHEANYNEFGMLLTYHHKYWKWIIDVGGDLFLGYRNRNYNDWFMGRDCELINAGILTKIKPVKWLRFYFIYYFESSISPTTTEVMILDEPDYQIDFNNDRDFADNNRRTEQTVNRSYFAQNIEFGLKLKPIKNLKLYGKLEYRFEDYKSEEPIDPNYKGRNDTKNRYAFGLDYLIIKDLHFLFKYEITNQLTNREGDPESTGEITDYEIHKTTVGVKWKF